MFSTQLSVVDERASETGFKEDLDRKEFDLLDEIENLEKRIRDVQGIVDLTQKDIENIHKQSKEFKINKNKIEKQY